MRGTFKERFALPALVILVVSGLLIGAYVVSDMQRPLRGTIRPELALTSLRGTPTHLPSPFFSKHIILVFSPTCPHCRTELGHFTLLSEIMPEVPVFGISLHSPELTDSMAASVGAGFPVFIDRDGSVRSQFSVSRVPMVLFVGEDDVIRLSLTGARSFQEDSLLMARFVRAGAPGASDAGRLDGTDIRMSPAASVEKDQRRNEQKEGVPTACPAGKAGSRTDPVGPRVSAGKFALPDGPRQAAGPFTHYSSSLFKKEVPSCVPG